MVQGTEKGFLFPFMTPKHYHITIFRREFVKGGPTLVSLDCCCSLTSQIEQLSHFVLLFLLLMVMYQLIQPKKYRKLLPYSPTCSGILIHQDGYFQLTTIFLSLRGIMCKKNASVGWLLASGLLAPQAYFNSL